MYGEPARLLRIHISESDRWNGKPLYDVIVAACREQGIAGVTVFRGLEGYGDTAEMHRAGLIGQDPPIAITIVDKAEAIARILPAIETMMTTALISISEVGIKRIQKPSAASPGQ